MVRQYFRHGVDELEKLFKDNLHNRGVLGDLRDELTYRENDRAKQLLREMDAVLAGTVPIPRKPPKASSPDGQGILRLD